MVKNTLELVEGGNCPSIPAGLSIFSKVGLAALEGTLQPATPEFSSSTCTSVPNAALESNVEIDSAVKSNPAIEVDVSLLSNAVPSARPMMESTGLDVVAELPDNDFVLTSNWSMTSLRSSELVNSDNSISNEELTLVKVSLVETGGEERLLCGDVVVVRLGQLGTPVTKVSRQFNTTKLESSRRTSFTYNANTCICSQISSSKVCYDTMVMHTFSGK